MAEVVFTGAVAGVLRTYLAAGILGGLVLGLVLAGVAAALGSTRLLPRSSSRLGAAGLFVLALTPVVGGGGCTDAGCPATDYPPRVVVDLSTLEVGWNQACNSCGTHANLLLGAVGLLLLGGALAVGYQERTTKRTRGRQRA